MGGIFYGGPGGGGDGGGGGGGGGAGRPGGARAGAASRGRARGAGAAAPPAPPRHVSSAAQPAAARTRGAARGDSPDPGHSLLRRGTQPPLALRSGASEEASGRGGRAQRILLHAALDRPIRHAQADRRDRAATPR